MNILDYGKIEILKIISGGQTGADEGGLHGAKERAVPTGGTAPRGYRTEKGSNFKLRDMYGLSEHSSSAYPPRTEQNVKESDITLIFGNDNSPGCKLTKKFCRKHNRPFIVIKSDNLHRSMGDTIDAIRKIGHPITINVAGNRESSTPGIFELTSVFIRELIDQIQVQF